MNANLRDSGPKGAEEPKPEKKLPRKDKETPENNLDKTLADSFPASDPPSSIPDPEEEDAA
jgi:hypothetical protein